MFWAETWKNIRIIIWKLPIFVVKFSIYLKRRVFVMPALRAAQVQGLREQDLWYSTRNMKFSETLYPFNSLMRRKSHEYVSLTMVRCRQTKPEINILFAVFVFAGTKWEKPGPESVTKNLTVEAGFHYENMPIQIYWKFYYQTINIFR